jgi:hypothetical protein
MNGFSDVEKITTQNSQTNQSEVEEIINILNRWGDVQFGTFGFWVYLYFDNELYVTDELSPEGLTLEKIIGYMMKIDTEASKIQIYHTFKRVYNLKKSEIEDALNVLWYKDSVYDTVNLDWKDRYVFLRS